MGIVKKILFVTAFILSVNSVFGTEGFTSGDPKIKIISCYPNPASTNINFDFTAIVDKGYTLTVYNFIGKKVDEINLTSSRNSLNLEGYYRGLYVYQLRNKQGKLIESGKFQVVK